jgi:AcrR family transcriptional regulator
MIDLGECEVPYDAVMADKEERAMASRTVRPERGSATRELILATAERLFAEHGVHAVSNRQISEAAGQGNSAAVGYHFGTKADLVRAIARKHADEMEQLRVWMVADVAGSTDVRDWVACLVRPFTRMADPALYQITVEESLPSPSLRLLVDGLSRCLSDLPVTVREERWAMARHLIVHMCVERERALAEGAPTLQSSWDDLATSLFDVIVGLWQAPVTPRSQ